LFFVFGCGVVDRVEDGGRLFQVDLGVALQRPRVDGVDGRTSAEHGQTSKSNCRCPCHHDWQVAGFRSAGVALLLRDGVGVVGQAEEVSALAQDGIQESKGLVLNSFHCRDDAISNFLKEIFVFGRLVVDVAHGLLLSLLLLLLFDQTGLGDRDGDAEGRTSGAHGVGVLLDHEVALVGRTDSGMSEISHGSGEAVLVVCGLEVVRAAVGVKAVGFLGNVVNGSAVLSFSALVVVVSGLGGIGETESGSGDDLLEGSAFDGQRIVGSRVAAAEVVLVETGIEGAAFSLKKPKIIRNESNMYFNIILF